MGRDLAQLKRYDECETVRRAGFEWAPDVDDEATLLARLVIGSDLGNVLVNQGKRTQALQVLTQTEAIAATRPAGQASRFENGFILSNYHAGFDEARELQAARRAYEGMQTVTTRSPDDRASYARLYGIALLDNGLAAQAEAVLRQSQALYAEAYGRSSRNGVAAFARVAESVGRQGDFARAERMLDDETQALSSDKAALPPFTERRLLERRLEDAWLAGDLPALRSLVPSVTDASASPATLRDDLPLLEYKARALALMGRGQDALATMAALRARWPTPDRATSAWVGLLGELALAQLAAGHPDDARSTARALGAVFEHAQAPDGRGAANAAELEALASVRVGDHDGAAKALRRADRARPAPPFRCDVERADSLLRRSEILAALGRGVESVASARDALALLKHQNPDSPRLARARQAAGR